MSVGPALHPRPLLGEAFGYAGATAIGLLTAHATSDRTVAWLDRALPPARPPLDMIDQVVPSDAFRIYSAAIVTVGVVVLTFALALARARRSERATRLLHVASPLVALIAATLYAGDVIVLAVATMAALIPVLLRPASPVYTRPSGKAALLYVLAGEVACAAWGVWLTTGARPLIVASILALTALLVARRILPATLPSLRRGVLDAKAFLPLALSPLLGLLRSPPPIALLVLLALCLVLRHARPLRVHRRWLTARTAVALVTWAIMAAFAIPLAMRDLPTINFDGHEAPQYGWVNSALRGKLLMADASTVYGPLREYSLAAFAAVFGADALRIRVAQVLANLAGLAVCAPLLQSIARRRLTLEALGAYLILVGTHLFAYLDYPHNYSFGWADFGRTAFPTALAYGGVFVLGQSSRWARFVVGLLAGGCIFYAQEVGPVSAVAILVGAISEPLLARGAGARAARLRTVLQRSGAYLAGAICATLLFLLPYVIEGRLRLFSHTLFFTASLFDAGYGAKPFPVAASDYFHWGMLVWETSVGGREIEYLLAPGIYIAQTTVLIATAFRGTWSRRDSALLALLFFGAVSYRVALGRTDDLHLTSVTLPAVLLLVNLLGDASEGIVRVAGDGARRVPVQCVLAIAVGVAASNLTGFTHGLKPKVASLLSGEERPSSGPRYDYADLPRAGDMKIAPQTVEIVRIIRAHSSAAEPIFYRGTRTFGGDYYFLSDRRNPTRFDAPLEVFTRSLQREATFDIERDPPRILVTEDPVLESAELRAYFEANYRRIGAVGSITIEERARP